MLESLARLGFASKAVVYGIVGTLAILTATNRGGSITDTSGALRVVLLQPFGKLLLLVLAAGLGGYAVWRVLDAVVDPDRNGTRPRGLVIRAGNMVRGGIYGALALEAIRLFRGLGGSNGNAAESWTARALELPLGSIVVGMVGTTIALYGVSEVVDSVRSRQGSKLDWSAVPPNWRRSLRNISRFGVLVRGGLITTLGVFLLLAAINHNPDQAAGSRESLLRLGGLFEGRWFLALIAAGVLAYAVDQALHARCRRIRPVL